MGVLAFMNYLEIPLNLEGVEVEGVEFTDRGEIFITVTPLADGTDCHVCGQRISDFYGRDREIVLRH